MDHSKLSIICCVLIAVTSATPYYHRINTRNIASQSQNDCERKCYQQISNFFNDAALIRSECMAKCTAGLPPPTNYILPVPADPPTTPAPLPVDNLKVIQAQGERILAALQNLRSLPSQPIPGLDTLSTVVHQLLATVTNLAVSNNNNCGNNNNNNKLLSALLDSVALSLEFLLSVSCPGSSVPLNSLTSILSSSISTVLSLLMANSATSASGLLNVLIAALGSPATLIP